MKFVTLSQDLKFQVGQVCQGKKIDGDVSEHHERELDQTVDLFFLLFPQKDSEHDYVEEGAGSLRNTS